MRVLLSEGSGLTARQVATRLGVAGHEVEVASAPRVCLARFTKHVRRVHAVPSFARDPLGWFDAVCALALARRVDAIFATHEQVTVLAALAHRLPVPCVLPSYASLRRVQSKLRSFETLREAGVPQPEGSLVHSDAQFDACARFPCFVKRAVSTAGRGVLYLRDRAAWRAARPSFSLAEGALVQQPARGPLAMVQCVASHGALRALHVNERVREGLGGGASHKRSVRDAAIERAVEALLSRLRWHGPISFDVIRTAEGPRFIDVNPRLVEPMNAWHAGVDLVGATLALLSAPARAEREPASREDVRTHQLLLALLYAARAHGRLGVVRELVAAARGRDDYAASVEELTPVRTDPYAALPCLVASAATLVAPAASRLFEQSAVGSYALSEAGALAIERAFERERPDEARSA